MDFSRLGLNDLLSGIATGASKEPVRAENIIPTAPVPVKSDELVVRYGDPELDRKLASSGPLKSISITGLPMGIRLSQGVDKKGFYFYFDEGGHDFKRFYHPTGLCEIKVNSNFINVDNERKWLIEAYVSRYNRRLGSFTSLNNASHLSTMISYFCMLSQMPEHKLNFLLQVLNRAVNESSDPYLRLYLFDVVMARVLKLLVVRKFKARLMTIDQEETLAVVDTAIELLNTIKEDSSQALAALNCEADPQQFMPLSGSSLRSNPKSFWAGAFYQAQKRHELLTECQLSLRADTVLELVSETEIVLTLKEGVEGPAPQEPQTAADQMEFHIQKMIKPSEARAVNWSSFK